MRALLLLASLSMVICVSVSGFGVTWYVDGSVAASGDGKSWHTAVKTIQEGINLAFPGDTVLVASADSPYFETWLDFDRKAVTVKSEDGASATIIDCGGLQDVGFNFDSGDTENSILDGFTIRNGSVGIACSAGSSPTIMNCVLWRHGDGIGCSENSNPSIVACTISENTFGGITCDRSSRPTISDSTIAGNRDYGIGLNNASDATITGCTFSGNEGPGLRCRSSSPAVRSCTFSGNGDGIACEEDSNPHITGCTLSQNDGSGIRCDRSNPTIASCLIFDNGAELGGGIHCFWANPTIVNCTVRGFSLEQGAEVFCSNSRPVITNTILWGDSERPLNWDPASDPQVTYSVVRSGWLGEGNTADDPEFRNFTFADFRLRVDSPCIDAGASQAEGLPETDVQGIHRIMYGGKSLTVDIGAYEFHIWPPTADSQTGDLTLKWSSLVDKTYSVYRSGDMLTWELAADDVASTGDTVTTWIDPEVPLLSSDMQRQYYRIIENPQEHERRVW